MVLQDSPGLLGTGHGPLCPASLVFAQFSPWIMLISHIDTNDPTPTLSCPQWCKTATRFRASYPRPCPNIYKIFRASYCYQPCILHQHHHHGVSSRPDPHFIPRLLSPIAVLSSEERQVDSPGSTSWARDLVPTPPMVVRISR